MTETRTFIKDVASMWSCDFCGQQMRYRQWIGKDEQGAEGRFSHHFCLNEDCVEGPIAYCRDCGKRLDGISHIECTSKTKTKEVGLRVVLPPLPVRERTVFQGFKDFFNRLRRTTKEDRILDANWGTLFGTKEN